MTNLKLKRLEHGADLPLPYYATEGAAGMDICSAVSKALYAGDTHAVATGFAVEVPEGYELQVRSRSGLALKGIVVANSPGTIDSDYRGEIKVLLHNQRRTHYMVKRGERIAQLVLAPVTIANVVEVEELSETARGEGGFGSTGS